MTETNPVASTSLLKPEMEDWDLQRQLDFLETAGIPVTGLQVKIVDDVGQELPHDGEAFGELLIRGPWIAAEYYKDTRSAQSFEDGWLRTGDVCKITPEGYIKITDRAKDVIKSGGEWIGSIELENLACAHPAVAQAAVIGIAHPKWDERPLLVIVAKPGAQPSREEMLAWYDGKIAKWWTPDDVVFVEQLPLTATGKISKLQLREQFRDHRLPA
jgi:fatty-acyl-CoA synthase